jgi:hypothetical protein
MSTKITFIIALLGLIIISIAVLKPSTEPSVTGTTSPATVPATAQTTSGSCLITVDGQKYDVTIFRNQHSGGDVFNCGTDMSTVFHDKHNQRYLQMMAPYKL